ncbi:MAG TPA: pyridoxamine 5'-phosphate oxidase family protein [Dehalococcoidia bacterium]|jgi:PPOX class probable F420-dependent enzyme|nr:pyridoxamine 5'-phosphate oxidase family protein [Dehalococcoidia bacterium]
MADATPEVTKFLQDHRLCVFATGRKDGSPQQSYIGYQFDGRQFLLGGQATSFKMRNLRRNPGCSMLITEGRGFVLVYGTAELVEDEEGMAKLHERFGPRAAPPRPEGAAPPPPRPMGKRIAILMTPTKIIADRMNG